jgi:hypothetical protein
VHASWLLGSHINPLAAQNTLKRHLKQVDAVSF